mgnify:CR=1 FL=1
MLFRSPPVLPRLVSKLIWTTIVSTAIFAICAYLYVNRIVTLDAMARWMGV